MEMAHTVWKEKSSHPFFKKKSIRNNIICSTLQLHLQYLIPSSCMSPNVILQQYTESSPPSPLGADIAMNLNFLFVSA